MSILRLIYKPTQVYITKLARRNCAIKYGDDLACLMFESVRNSVNKDRITAQNIKTPFQRFIDKFRKTKEMTINISSDDKYNFFVNSNLKIGRHNFVSEKQPFDFEQTLFTLKNFRATVEKTRDDVLTKLGDFNKLKRNLKRKIHQS